VLRDRRTEGNQSITVFPRSLRSLGGYKNIHTYRETHNNKNLAGLIVIKSEWDKRLVDRLQHTYGVSWDR